MNKVQPAWNDFICDSRGCYLVNDPEITFIDHEEAAAHCDEHNRALAGQAVLQERAAIVAWLRDDATKCDCFAHSESECACGAWGDYKLVLETDIADRLEAGDHLKEQETPNE